MKIPKVFISYSWDSDEHKQWVLDFATDLRVNGVEVILDQWHLRLGMDQAHFMEQSVAQSDRVLLVGTPQFAKKSADRKGGVGWETSIVTAELAEDLTLSKFIPVLRSGEYKTSFPSWLKGRTGVDLRSNPYSPQEFEKLKQELLDQTPQPPPVGARTPTSSAISSTPLSPPVQTFEPAKALDGSARFRANGAVLGAKWDQMPFATTHREVTLAKGPAVWLRIIPLADPGRTWSPSELKAAGTQNGAWLLPFFGSDYFNLRAEDGFGIYSSFDPKHEEAFGVAFAFHTGEVWSVDTHLLSHGGEIYVADMFKELVDRLPDYAGLLSNLGLAGPHRWEAGLEGIKGMRLIRPADHQFFQRPVCLANQIKASGQFSLGDDPNAVLYPILRKLYDQCGLPAPTIPQVGVPPTLNQPERLNAIAYSFFERKGSDDRMKLYIRPTGKGNLLSLESVPGGEIIGPQSDIADAYAQKTRELERGGYTRMNAMNATGDPQFG